MCKRIQKYTWVFTAYELCAGPSGHAIWGKDLDCLDGEIVGSNTA
jgi:hypothetical protein